MPTTQEVTSVLRARRRDSWLLAAGFVGLAIPAISTLAAQTWATEEGGHGPLILCTAAWLLWRQIPALRQGGVPGRTWVVTLGAIVSLLMYVFGEAFDFITLEAAGLYAIGVTIFYSLYGRAEVFRNWFIFLYLLFAVPPPRSWLDGLTFPLKQLVSAAATALLRPFGIPVTHEGVAIYVAQYQYLVEDACSGLNSIVGLLALSLFYIYLSRPNSWRYSIFLAALTIPIAIVANISRIIILILLTEYFGDDVGQGFMHFAAGMVVFAIALLIIFAVDALFAPFFTHERKSA
jgi:exosortase